MSVTISPSLSPDEADAFDAFVNQTPADLESHNQWLLSRFELNGRTENIFGGNGQVWDWKDLPLVDGKKPGRLIIITGHMNIHNTTYSERLALHTLTIDVDGIYLARRARVLAIYT